MTFVVIDPLRVVTGNKLQNDKYFFSPLMIPCFIKAVILNCQIYLMIHGFKNVYFYTSSQFLNENSHAEICPYIMKLSLTSPVSQSLGTTAMHLQRKRYKT